MEKTLAIIKPDAVARGLTEEILRRVEAAGLKVRAKKRLRLSRTEAARFYDVHRERPFFDSLCEYITSGPVVVALLEGDRAITRWRELMGATDPAKAAPGTIRKEFGVDIERNAVHGSDAPETAAVEVAFFFKEAEQGS